MKLFASILSIYILLLTAIPCVDVPPDKNLHKMQLFGQTTNDHPSDTDHCTPFCPCDCCLTPVIQEEPSIQLNCMDFTFREYSDYSVSYISTLFAFIWQPPKIS